MAENPLLKLAKFGQSIWLDFISRGTLSSGLLQRLIEEDGICGVTSNPAIFEKAIVESHDYDGDIGELSRQGKTVEDIYQTLTVADIRRTADLFLPVYAESHGIDGLVSLEVSPHLARDTNGTILEARKLWAAVDRPNLLIKVPATDEGISAIEQLLIEGINVNITLLFGLPRYRSVADAYLAALETRAARNLPLNRISSVASFFLSRIDVLVDPLLEKHVENGGTQSEIAASLLGRVAIAQAKLAYQIYKEVFSGEEFRALAVKGARPQRLLWASTSTKNPAYKDVMYVEPLIGPETVNTMPLETIDAYRNHGDPASRLEDDIENSNSIISRLQELDISMPGVVHRLEEEGIQKFVKPFDALYAALETARRKAST